MFKKKVVKKANPFAKAVTAIPGMPMMPPVKKKKKVAKKVK